MDEYEKELLRKNLEVSQESLKLLRKMHRARVVGGIFKGLKWIIIIGISLGSYYYVEPYLRSAINALGGNASVTEQVRTADGGTNPNGAPPDILEKLKNLLLPK